MERLGGLKVERLGGCRGIVQGQWWQSALEPYFPSVRLAISLSTLCLACSDLKLSLSGIYKTSLFYISSSNIRIWVCLVWGRDSITFLSHTGIRDCQFFLEELNSLHQKSSLKMYWLVSELSVLSYLCLAVYTRLAWNSKRSACFCLLSTWIKGMCHHT